MFAESKFSIQEALKTGFNGFVDHIGFFIKSLLVGSVFIISLGCSTAFIFYRAATEQPSFLSLFLWALVSGLVMSTMYLIVEIGFTGVYLDIIDEKKVELRSLVSRLSIWPKAFIVFLLYSILVWFGLALFFVPGIIVGTIYQFAVYEVIDRNCGIIEAFTRSAEITRGSRMQLFCYALIQFFIGFTPLLIFRPVLTIGQAYIYRSLDKRELHTFMNTSFFN